ncbi:hypothetical protein BofuT4_P006500.1 [Botrytis cinerea T4]|uniref:Uncharacterized protein n=1 Tax=Botryotinia fuckeliana (strain T4) TaxID=999810 RepID=G2Y4A1_BOTF4|nr:hypothetical protein BofuT4_P006500.1 [Botrytis cinerea T4]
MAKNKYWRKGSSRPEIQGFLLTRKKAPRKAVEEIGAWVQATRKSKVEGQKFT